MLNVKPAKKVSYRHWDDARNKPVPAIILEGNFLRELGFECGNKLTLEYNQGRITIVNPNIQPAYVPSIERASTPQLADSHADDHATVTV